MISLFTFLCTIEYFNSKCVYLQWDKYIENASNMWLPLDATFSEGVTASVVKVTVLSLPSLVRGIRYLDVQGCVHVGTAPAPGTPTTQGMYICVAISGNISTLRTLISTTVTAKFKSQHIVVFQYLKHS